MSGDINFWINDNSGFDNRLVIRLLINDDWVTVYTHIVGNVSSDGKLIALIKMQEGESKIGDFFGNLSDLNGSGEYSIRYSSTQIKEGEWTAFKQ